MKYADAVRVTDAMHREQAYLERKVVTSALQVDLATATDAEVIAALCAQVRLLIFAMEQQKRRVALATARLAEQVLLQVSNRDEKKE